MNERNGAAALREDYLRRLDEAMRALPYELAVELRSGIAEELQGEDAPRVARRIAGLGDPAQVAEAAAEAAEIVSRPETMPAPAVVRPERKTPVTESRGFAVASAITLGVGGIVVPVAGWLVGIGLVSYCRFWRLREKLWAVFAPFLAAALGWAVYAAIQALSVPAAQDCIGFCPPGAENPLLPSVYSIAWSSLLLGYLLGAPLGGLWLLLRLRGRAIPVAAG